MRNVLLASLLALSTFPFAIAGSPSSNPKSEELQLVTQLPEVLPRRVMGLAYDGEKLWASVYHGQGRYATLDPSSLLWTISSDAQQQKAISKLSEPFASPGGICFANGVLWVAGSYGESFGSIDIGDWKIQRVFKGKKREESTASQSYSGMAFDGSHLWIAWHWFRYDLPVSQTQLLLKVDPEKGKVVSEYAAPAGNSRDATHGLTWDGSKLWHAKENRLSSIDPSTGQVTAKYIFHQIKRPSGLAWDGQALWIAEFDGKIWRLPF
jgi:hypothetical protein